MTLGRLPLEIVIVDRPGAGSGCACAGAANPELPRFAGDVEWLRWRVAAVRRIDPRDAGTGFPDLPAARAALDERGTEALPLILVDGLVVHSGSYPSRAQLETILAETRPGAVADQPPGPREAPPLPAPPNLTHRLHEGAPEPMSDAPTPRPASSCCGDHTTPSDAACCGGSAATPGSTTSCCGAPSAEDARPASAAARRLDVELLVIDLESCARCVPTGDQLRSAIRLLAPAAEALDIRLTYRETVAQTAEEARERALLSSPTIRVNGRDIDQDIHESVCESCGDLTDNEVSVDCREWHYRGRVYGAAPLPLLVEALMGAMLGLDEEPPVTPEPLAELPANLQRYFANKRPAGASGCCC